MFNDISVQPRGQIRNPADVWTDLLESQCASFTGDESWDRGRWQANYPSRRIVFLRENKEAPAVSEVSELFLLVLLLCDVTIAAALSCALGDTCFAAAEGKQLSLSRSEVLLRFPLPRPAALVSLIL